ncbi:hypothetical protein [Chromobacterium subtsugae]|uniref:hypothetical protein n=1 Tax=Chromobacterium subtsugae TaxID=251747 RepID=UPI000A70B9B2|nr:hypothetical protein [Chromobacterium subtsugae]
MVLNLTGNIMGKNVELQFKDAKGGDRAKLIKWMRNFYTRWGRLKLIFNSDKFPFKTSLFDYMSNYLNEGVDGRSKLSPNQRLNLHHSIVSQEDIIVAIEENSDLVDDLISENKMMQAGYAILYLSGRKLPESDFSASQHESYAEVKEMVDKDPRTKKYGAEGVDDGEAKVALYPSSTLDQATLKLAALLGEKERQLEASSQALSQTVANFDSQFVEFKDQWNKDFSLIKEAYDKNMALQAPVRYWGSKRKKHQWWAIGTGAVVMILMALSMWLLSCQVKSVKQGYVAQAANTMKKKAAVPKVIADASNAKSTASSSEAELLTVDSNGWHFDLALLLLEATLCFWVIRIGVRMLLSHIHLENDAAERVTMAQTYIALLRRGKLPEGDDLKTVLAALFRPSGDGIVKDEGIPPSMMDLLTKLKT